MMVVESVRAMLRQRRPGAARRKLHRTTGCTGCR